MLSYSELKIGTFFVMNGEPYEVLEYAFLRMQQRKPVAQTKIKNLITGKVTNQTFHQNDSFEEASLEHQKSKFLYSHRGDFVFCHAQNPGKRFTLNKEQMGEQGKFLKANTLIDAVLFNEKIINIILPIKIELEVVEAPPSIKGSTVTGGNKLVKLETGADINVPMFINQGDIVRVNTQTGEYTERVSIKK
ncbi:MAG: Elongation factor P [Parcubacteria group bacterium GW2011_GWD2_38_12]|nr:MAG: Elongation factor P [Parcubacteria group bacterium GW2011_GWC2_36_17]KKQ39499.1 MAG: Elongation factor P [Candidatus Moranbacteria bacterium GW2011_GWF2_37_7]KKQ41628.1 MAG: Elongation factor P [Parcubacteria group bacterium GW2011_GWE2_37_8]KKQ50987.1 MAG: Elongation factor P [Parcubacteria group bacterium GW2011_GWD2_38_12]KKQ58146.1 MAG: Elongation factor P [Parcubacteria group bacterium GW2011_GWD1_38_16]